MTVKVLIVDDSAVIRGLIAKSLAEESQISVTGTAGNGQLAVDMATSMQPDVVVLDIQMPVMDGMTALPLLKKAAPSCKIIMASALTQQNAAIAIEALSLGADDYIGKPTSSKEDDVNVFYTELVRKIRALGGIMDMPQAPAMEQAAIEVRQPAKVINAQGVKALAIASSTGGPQALMSLFADLAPGLRHIPIFITQHMPPHFTRILAEHLAKIAGRPCAEAAEGEPVKAGHVYLAPGDYHMLVARTASGAAVIRLTQDPPENFCRPAADPMLRSLSDIYGGHLAVLVLTGMGHDALEGCKMVVEKGGSVIAQDAASSVVYGMPRAVAEHGLCKAILPLPNIGPYLRQQIDGNM